MSTLEKTSSVGRGIAGALGGMALGAAPGLMVRSKWDVPSKQPKDMSFKEKAIHYAPMIGSTVGGALLGYKGFKHLPGSTAKAISGKITAPRGFAKGIHTPGDVDRFYKGFRHQAIKGGDESLLMWPIKSLGAKILPRKMRHSMRNLSWNLMGAPALRADMALGSVLEKTPLIGKGLFRVTEEIPWGHGLKKEITRSSALAPLIKAKGIAEPILIGVGLEKGIKKLRNINSPEALNQDQNLREKVASVMLQLHEQNKEHEKRAHALRLLFKQAELGITQLPQTHSELETKLASLVTEDLVVLEKALELTGGTIKLGELGHLDAKAAISPVEKFQATILGDEI